MTILTFTLILLLAAYSAGLLGSLTGLGGGVVVIPVLTLGFGVDFHYAIGAALVASIATSSGSGSAYVKEGITNIRLGMFLEIATTLGAVCGAAVAIYLNNNVIAVIYGAVLLLTAAMQQRRKSDRDGGTGSATARRLKLFGTGPQKDGTLKSNIVPFIPGGSTVSAPRGMIQYVATEYGIAKLSGLSLRERAEEMIRIAHPDFREELERYAKETFG